MNVGKYGGNICYFHPKEVVIGVCHICLNERLLILSTQQGVKSSKSTKYDYYTSNKRCYNININNNSSYYYHNHHKPKPYIITLPKFFPIASFFKTRDSFRHRIRRHRHHDSHHDFFDDVDAASTSLEDESFISIKFGDNGVALWDKTSNKVSKVSLEHCSLSWGSQTTVKDTNKTKDNGSGNKNVVKQANPLASVLLRWRMRIGQILHVSRLKKASKANNASRGNNSNTVVGGVKVVRNNKGWIRIFKFRTKVWN